MKRIILSLAVIAVVSVVAVGATRAYFSDTETSTGNTFSAGTIDIAIDQQNPWTSHYDIGDLKPGETGYINFDIQNVGQNPVNVSKHLGNFAGTGGIENYPCPALDENAKTSSEPECVRETALHGRVDNVQTQIIYDLSVKIYGSDGETNLIGEQLIYTDADGKTLSEVYPNPIEVPTYVSLGMIPAGGHMKVTQSYHFNPLAGNEYQGDKLSFDITVKGEQIPQEGGTPPASPATVNLRTAGNFAILTKAGITDVPSSIITGNIGTSPISGTAIGVTCPEVTGTIYSVDAAGPSCKVTNASLLTTAVNDMQTAYTNAAGQPHGVGPNLNVGGGTVTTQTLAPGTYTWGSNVNITGDITLTGSATDVWIFQITGTLGIDANKKIILGGSALPQNIFWQVADTVTLKPGSHLEGNILAQTNIAMQSGATLDGRALAQTAVTLIANTITIP